MSLSSDHCLKANVGIQNGLIISTVAASSGFYLFLVLYLAPRIWKYFGSADSNPRSANVDYALAMLSMLSFATTSFLLAWATERWQVYSCKSSLL